MSTGQTHAVVVRKPLRLWPGIAAVLVQWIAWLVVPLVAPEAAFYGFLAALGCGAVVLVWWLFFSRAPWVERLGAIVLMVAAVVVTYYLVHPSIANASMGMMLTVYSIPALSLALVVAVVLSRYLTLTRDGRRAAIAASIVVACGHFTLIRTGGVSGEGRPDLHWRWTPTHEDRLLAQADDVPPARSALAPDGGGDTPLAEDRSVPTVPPAAPPEQSGPPAEASTSEKPVETSAPKPSAMAADVPRAEVAKPATTGLGTAAEAEWPGFRGPERDGVVRGVRIETDWSRTPPVELWRKPIGPAWSSFAVGGDLLYTQEQRGEDEIVSCYRLSTGEPVWRHRDAVRFWEANAGPGPRATPTLAGGRVYTLGATGIVNALDARTGERIWTRNAAVDTGKEIPTWGLAGSPLIAGDLVIVAVSSQLIAYDIRTGETRWVGPPEGAGYSSPHLLTIDGVDQVLLLRGRRTTSFAPADGTVLWEHSWEPSAGILQPAVMRGGDVLLTSGGMTGGIGLRRLSVARDPSGWTVVERWTSRALKPYFNDFVVHEGHAYGFDGSILACVDLETGQRKWKGGRYGHGQLVLLADQDVLLVLSEDGELALVGAVPDGYKEIAKVPAIDGKTWNHPVLVRDTLLVRNGEEMAAFRLASEP